MVNRYFGSYKINTNETIDQRFWNKAIPQHTWEEYERVTTVLEDFAPIGRAYDCAARNDDALTSAVHRVHDEVATTHISHSSATEWMLEAISIINQHLFNAVASSRSFIESTSGHLKRTFGETDQRYTSYERQTKELADQHFSFRFLKALRDHGAHLDTPVSAANIEAVRDSNDRLHLKLGVFVDLQSMLASRKLDARIRKELAKLPQRQVDLLPIIQEQGEWNRDLFRGIVERDSERLMLCANYLQKLTQRMNVPADEIAVIWEGDDRPAKHMRSIPWANLDRLRRLAMIRGPASLVP